MSGSIRRRFEANVDDSVVDDDAGSVDDEGEPEEREAAGASRDGRGENKHDQEQKKRKKRRLSSGYKKGVRRVRTVVLLQFRKLQKLLGRDSIRRPSSFSHDHSSIAKLPSTGTRIRGYFCCLCMSRPQTVEDIAADGQKKKDVDDPETSLVALKVLLEENDFYAKECNTHFSD